LAYQARTESWRGAAFWLADMSSRTFIASKTFLPPATLIVAAAALVLGGFGPNSLLAILAVAVLFWGSRLLWRPGETPILLFVFGYQWLQASTQVFHANWLGMDVAALAPFGGNIQLAIVLSLLGLVVLALGLRLGAGPWRRQYGAMVRSHASQHGPQYWFRLYGVALLIATLAQSVASAIPGLSQPLLALASLKWAFYWMLAYATFTQPGTNRQYWLLAFGLELLLGLGGYFSGFKVVLFFTLFAAVAAGIRPTPRLYLGLLTAGALTLLLGLAWTAVKGEYRQFVSGGENAQIVTVTYTESIAKLADLVAHLDASAMADASNQLLKRVAYVNYFGMVLDTVPRILPHEGGALWWDAIAYELLHWR
jgi:hypothetical protein